jgi:hypothetical protein
MKLRTNGLKGTITLQDHRINFEEQRGETPKKTRKTLRFFQLFFNIRINLNICNINFKYWQNAKIHLEM